MCLSDLKSEAAGFGQKVVQQRSVTIVTMCFKTLKETDLKEPTRPEGLASRCNLCVSGYESESKIIRRQMFQEPWKQELETSSTALPLLRKQWCKKGSLAVCATYIYIYIYIDIHIYLQLALGKRFVPRIVMICDAPTLHRKLTGEPIRGVQICFNRLEIVYQYLTSFRRRSLDSVGKLEVSHPPLRRLHYPKPPTFSKTSVVKAFTECLKFQRWKNYDKM